MPASVTLRLPKRSMSSWGRRLSCASAASENDPCGRFRIRKDVSSVSCLQGLVVDASAANAEVLEFGQPFRCGANRSR